MNDNNGWAGKPGVPLNPDRDGPHWLGDPDSDMAFAVDWSAASGWLSRFTQDTIAAHMRYLGPCLTPAEVADLVAKAKRDALEEAAREIDCAMRELFGDADEYKQGWNAGLEAGAAAIRALKGEGNE